ncbi:hypothetical protein HID58_095169 [Brassica napus]|uniref:Legume lectin domain-containing protein n=1 Tax=Brassica napus TaxID=3708 RepID=A0ABQ7X4M6_BRANA|nr:hypothetical protein HID58_095169 [Brassica napus]
MLTNYTEQRTGHAFYTKPIRFKDSPNGTVSSFSTTFVFAIHSEIPILSSHGMAFVVVALTQASLTQQQVNTWVLQHLTNGNDTNHVFAVELDTIRSTEFNDMDDNHVGIDINSMKSVNSSYAGYWNESGQYNNLTLISRRRMQVWVDYDGHTHQIDVTMLRSERLNLRNHLFPSSEICLRGKLRRWPYQNFQNFRCGSPRESTSSPCLIPPLIESLSIFLIPLLFISMLILLVRFIIRGGESSRRNSKIGKQGWEAPIEVQGLVPCPKGSRRRTFSDQVGGRALLVYDYMPNGSLDKYLYNNPEVTLDWKQRIKVINGVASALFYLTRNGNKCHGSDPQTTRVAGTWDTYPPITSGQEGPLLLPICLPLGATTRSSLRDGNILDAKDPNLGTECDQREVEMILKLDLSPLEFRGLGIHHGIGELDMFTCGSSMVDSIVSGGR